MNFFYKKLIISVVALVWIWFGGCNTAPADVTADAYQLRDALSETVQLLDIQLGGIRTEIADAAQMHADTFDLARKAVPIKKVRFLVNDSHSELIKNIRNYEAERITAAELGALVNESKTYLNNLFQQNGIPHRLN